MADVILLTDTVTNSALGDSRYIGSYSLATSLEKAGFKVIVIDYFLRHPDFFNYLKEFISNETLFIGVSSTFLSRPVSWNKLADEDYRKILIESTLSRDGNNRDEYHHLYRKKGLWFDDESELSCWAESVKQILRARNPDGQLIIGGAKTSLLLNQTVLSPFDYVVLGTANFSIVEFARSLKDKRPPEHQLFRNYKVITESQSLKNEIILPVIFTDKNAIAKNESLPLEISRGCSFNCKFCHYEKRGSNRKNLHLLKEEIIRNYETHGTNVYQFCDDCFNDSRAKVLETCSMFLTLPFQIEWISYARVDVAVKFPETMDIMIKSGAKGLFFGIESFNDQALKKAGKKIPSDEVKEFLLNTYQRYQEHCLFEGSFIVGLPGENEESIIETIHWMVQNKPLDFISVARLYLQPYSSTLDKTSMDYSEYSRSPLDYGITIESPENTQNPQWSHAAMTSQEASALSEKFLKLWSLEGKNTILRNIFTYPILRTLGFSISEIWDMARNESTAASWGMEANKRYVLFLENYWKTLKENNLGK